ncbi:hypothetical protein [Haloglomus halophilum]|uniref:hypothetical protein n=1 Tax=Haloglomus halophilum TaxID=2962672 RepID=UPI0020C9878A|nr:hypothetical protein [Haloglomus halophilum]
MRENEFHLSDCCVKCPHFDEFRRTCTHNLRQAIIQEMADESRPACPVFPGVRAQSMQELERKLSP